MSPDERGIWASGDSYEPYVGRWSRLVAREFVDWLAVPPGARWLDVGCGTGAVTATVLSRAAPAAVTGVDPSARFIDHARATIADSRATFVTGDARALPAGPATFDAIVSGLALNFVPDPERAAAEMRRVARPGAVVGAYVWDYAGKMELMRYFWDAAGDLDPAARQQDEGRRFPLCHPDALASVFDSAGFGVVETRAIDIPTVFRDFDDYWTPFLGGQGPAPGYCMSLPDDRRTALRDTLRARLPHAADGTIPMIARAWAVKAGVPR